MAKRLNISLSDKADELLQSLARDCEMSVSQCLSQIILRNHAQFRVLFALEDTDLHQLTPTYTESDTTLHTITRDYTDLHATTHNYTGSDTNLHTITPTDVIPCNPVSKIDPQKELDFLDLIKNS